MSWSVCKKRWKILRASMRWTGFWPHFGEVQEEYEHLGGYTLEAQAREVLHGLGFTDDQIDGDVGALVRRLENARRAGARSARPARRAADG